MRAAAVLLNPLSLSAAGRLDESVLHQGRLPLTPPPVSKGDGKRHHVLAGGPALHHLVRAHHVEDVLTQNRLQDQQPCKPSMSHHPVLLPHLEDDDLRELAVVQAAANRFRRHGGNCEGEGGGGRRRRRWPWRRRRRRMRLSVRASRVRRPWRRGPRTMVRSSLVVRSAAAP